MPLDALTNFPNGLSTSVIVLTDEGIILSGDDGATIDLGTLQPIPLSGGAITALRLDSTFDVTGTNGASFTSMQLNTTVIGQDNSSGTNVVTGLIINMDATAVTGAPGPTGIGLVIQHQPLSFSQYMGIHISGATTDATTSGTHDNSGISIGELKGDAFGASTVVNNHGVFVRVPIGEAASGGTDRNYGIYITGDGNPAGTVNYALYSASLMPSVFLGALTATQITTSNTVYLHVTTAALANSAAAQTATMTNAPVAGNPTKWISINDNGTARRIPAW